jgi:nitrite reductase (NADH) small subunit
MDKNWLDVGNISEVPYRGSRVVKTARGDIAIFKAMDGRIFALWDKCPHKGGPLSQGLESGEVQGPDGGCARKVPLKIENERIYLGSGILASVAA